MNDVSASTCCVVGPSGRLGAGVTAGSTVGSASGSGLSRDLIARGTRLAARIDALVLSRRIFSAVETGAMTIEQAAEEMESMAEALDENAENSPFDNLSFGGVDYMQFGDSGPLRMLFLNAAEKLKEAAER